jgi:hypothetical protein
MSAAGGLARVGRMTGAVGTGTPSLRRRATQSHIKIMPRLDLSDDEAAAAQIKEHHDTVDNDRHPFPARIRRLRGLLAKLKPEPAREPLPSPKVYTPPRLTAARRRRAGR